MTSIPSTQLNYSIVPISSLRRSSNSLENALKPSVLPEFRFDSGRLRWSLRRSSWRFCVRASDDSVGSGGDDGVGALKGMIDALPPAVLVVRRNVGSKFAIGIYIAFALFAVIARQVMLKRHSQKQQGSVADLVRRGQLRSDRRGISQPLKYEDPFSNPLVKVHKSGSTIEMCGKVYQLAPVKLTKEQQSEHQKRRSRAYHWKRPKVFLVDGDSIPSDIDPDAVRWLPNNHPFATTFSDIDEKMAQDNVSQKHGVPSRIKAEHEALQKKLEALQNGQNLNEMNIHPRSIQDSKDVVESIPHEHAEPIPSINTDPVDNHVSSNPNREAGSNDHTSQVT